MSFTNERLKELGAFPPVVKLNSDWLEDDKIKITLYGSINNIRYAVQVDYYDIDDSDYKEFDSLASAMQEYNEIKEG
tara:strand:+ start:114 stop:344 length:231 start_codon:yes stop_codon:yes gene_type:complete